MEFRWNMTEEDWKRLINHNALRKDSNVTFPTNDVYGNCYIGALCADIQHTLDIDDWYPFVNLFVLGIDDGYGELEDGTPYSLWNGSPRVPIRSKTFESFKKNFENIFEEFIRNDEKLLEYSKCKKEWQW